MRDPRLTRQHRPYVDELDTPGYNVMILPALEADSAHTRPLGDSESTQSTERQRRVIGSTLRRTRSIRERHKTMDEHGAAQQLKFEMISCDGGSLDLDDSGRYEAENLLRNDSSVYCTAKLENVNVILKGIAGRPFALSKLVIKAPQRSFTSPVKDGLVFVSMERIQVEDTGCYDRSELCSPDLPAHLEGCHSDLHRLLVSKELPSSTTELEDTAIPAHIIRPSAYFVIVYSSGSCRLLTLRTNDWETQSSILTLLFQVDMCYSNCSVVSRSTLAIPEGWLICATADG